MSEEPYDAAQVLLDERARLLAVGYRMLGSRAEAEDAVQETYLRFYRLAPEERDAVRNPAAWLTTAMTRVCLNVLDSARHRRESYVGAWLPEPLAAGSPLALGSTRPGARGASGEDPAEQASLADEVTMALMVLLDTLTPAQRVALVLHDVFGYTFDEIAVMVERTPQAVRKLASNARRQVAEERGREVPPLQQRQVAESFLAACRTGDVAALVARLDPQAVAISDGGGHVSAARRPIVGAERVARFLVGAFQKWPGLEPSLEDAPGETRIVLRRDGAVIGVGAFGSAGGLVTDIWLVMNPDKLASWNEPA